MDSSSDSNWGPPTTHANWTQSRGWIPDCAARELGVTVRTYALSLISRKVRPRSVVCCLFSVELSAVETRDVSG